MASTTIGTTVLLGYNDADNNRKWVLSGSTAQKPELVIQKRKVPNGAEGYLINDINVVIGTTDSAGDPIAQKFSLNVVCRYPVNGKAADAATALAAFRDLVASTEFAAAFNTGTYLADA